MIDVCEVGVWAQVFFDDGSVSEGKRISDLVFTDDHIMEAIGRRLLESTNRKDGFLVVWGAGQIRYGRISIFTSSSEESGSLASSQQQASVPEHS